MKKEDFTYLFLDDQQGTSALSEWRNRLSLSRDTIGGELFAAVCAVEANEEEKLTLKRLQTDCSMLIRCICATAHSYAEKIPVPRGFFVGEEHRVPAYNAVCRMLTDMESSVDRLRAISIRLTALREEYERRLCHVDPVGLSLMYARRAAQEQADGDILERIKELSLMLTEKAEETKALSRRTDKLQSYVSAYLTDLIPQLLRQLERVSDMAHDGASCDPIGAARLLSAFCDTVQRRNGGEECLNT